MSDGEQSGGNLLSKLVGQAFDYLTASGVAAGLHYGTVAVLTRVLTTSEFGAFALFQAIANFVAAVASLNFHAAANRYYLEDTDDFPSFVRTVVSFLFVANAVLLVVTFGLKAPAGAWLDLDGWVLFAGVAVGALRVPWLLLWKLLTAQMRSGLFRRLSVARDGLVFVATILGAVAVVGPTQRVRAVVGGAALATAVVGAAATAWLAWQGRAGALERKHLGYAAAFGLPLIPSSIAAVALNLLDRVVIQVKLGLEDTAVYAFAYNIGMVMSLASLAIYQAYLPMFTRLRDADDFEAIEASWKKIVGVMFALGWLLVLFAREAALVLGDEKYLGGLSIVPWVVLGYFSKTVGTLFLSYFIHHKRTWVNGLGAVLAAILNGGLNWWLIPIFGYRAAAWTTLASFLFVLVWYWGLTHWMLGESTARLRVWLPRFVVALFGLPLLQLALEQATSVSELIVIKSVGTLAVGVDAWMTMRPHPQD